MTEHTVDAGVMGELAKVFSGDRHTITISQVQHLMGIMCTQLRRNSKDMEQEVTAALSKVTPQNPNQLTYLDWLEVMDHVLKIHRPDGRDYISQAWWYLTDQGTKTTVTRDRIETALRNGSLSVPDIKAFL